MWPCSMALAVNPSEDLTDSAADQPAVGWRTGRNRWGQGSLLTSDGGWTVQSSFRGPRKRK